MVKLSFVIFTKAPLIKVWDFFSNFQNTAQWDPNVKSSKIHKETANKVGSTYDLVTIFNGNESDMQYTMTGYQTYKRIQLTGKNTMVQAKDEILFRQKNQGTEIEYRADICLRHIFGLFTPFIRKGLDDLVVEAKNGMQNKCNQLLGA